MIATGFHWRRGDNVILCPELEHPNNVYPWLNLRRYGARSAHGRRRATGHIPVDDMIAARSTRGTRVVTVSTVTFAPGFRTDVDTLGQACRERDVLLLVDAAQSVGVLHTDVRALEHRRARGLHPEGTARSLRHGISLRAGASGRSACSRRISRASASISGDAHEATIGG